MLFLFDINVPPTEVTSWILRKLLDGLTEMYERFIIIFILQTSFTLANVGIFIVLVIQINSIGIYGSTGRIHCGQTLLR